MKIQILSDLHLEMNRSEDVRRADADVVVVAGDLDAGAAGIDWLRSCWPETPVVYVAGNHEYWDRDVGRTAERLKQNADDPDRPSKPLDAGGAGIFVLEKEAFQIGPVTFLGCTFWTGFDLFGEDRRPEVMEACRRSVDDFECLGAEDGETAVSPETMRGWHIESRQWIREAARAAAGQGQKVVVVTHYAPSRRSVDPEYADSLTSGAFVAAAGDLVEEVEADAWIHGHVHRSFDYRIGRTRVVANPRGHPGENELYVPDLYIEV